MQQKVFDKTFITFAMVGVVNTFLVTSSINVSRFTIKEQTGVAS